MIVHQILPNMEYGDAISNYAVLLRRIMREWGADSEIYAQFVHPRLTRDAKLLRSFPQRLPADAVTIYHYSIGSEVSRFVAGLPGRKILIYHNITPPDYSLTTGGPLTARFYAGLEELKTFTDVPDVAVGVSEFNRNALRHYGFERTEVIPLIIDFDLFDRKPDPAMMTMLDDGWINFITVGRIYPHKKIEDVISVFAHYKRTINEHSRVFIIGDQSGMEDYYGRLKAYAERCGVADIVFTGKIGFRDLLAYYCRAHVYLCMSEHEGVCVPLLESMYLGAPIIAYNIPAVSETLGDAGVLVNVKRYDQIAEMADLLITDTDLRQRVIEQQKQRILDYRLPALAKALKRVLAMVGIEQTAR